jgi:hypothetical protein
MLFPFQLPCQFPRLRITAYDFETFGTDTVLSEVVIDLTREFRRLRKEGRIKLEEQVVTMNVPNFPDKPAGKLFFELAAITKQAAEQNPVGEAQEDPNRDPELEKPTEGRGITDFLKGTALDISGFKWFNFGLIAKILAVFTFLFILVVCFVYPGIMVK